MRKLLLVVLVISFGCGGPKDGDVYENKLTQRRVKIDVGECDDLKQIQESLNRVYEDVAKDMRSDGHNYSSLTDGNYKIIHADYKDSTTTCVGYDKTERWEMGTITSYEIITEEDFMQQFRLIK